MVAASRSTPACASKAPNARLRGQVTALAGVPDGTPAATATESIAATAAPSVTPGRSSEGTEEAPGEAKAILRRASRYAWAQLLARIDEVFPLVCPRCGGGMRIIAFITDAGAVGFLILAALYGRWSLLISSKLLICASASSLVMPFMLQRARRVSSAQ